MPVREIERDHAEQRHQSHVVEADHHHHAETVSPPPHLQQAEHGALADRLLLDRRNRARHPEEAEAHERGGKRRDRQRLAPIDVGEKKADRERRQHLSQRAADGVNAQDVSAPLLVVAREHARGDRVPCRIAHAGKGEQQRETPEARCHGGQQIADGDPPEGGEQQPAPVRDVIGEDAGRQVGERAADVADREQQADLGRRELHGDPGCRHDQPQRGDRPVVGEVAQREPGQEGAVFHDSGKLCSRRAGPRSSCSRGRRACAA